MRKSTVSKHANTDNPALNVIDGLSGINLHSEGPTGAWILVQDLLLLSAPFSVSKCTEEKNTSAQVQANPILSSGNEN